MQTAAGRVAFLAVGVRPGTGLAEAHDLASRLEGDKRRNRQELADVVVHTEPAGAEP